MSGIFGKQLGGAERLVAALREMLAATETICEDYDDRKAELSPAHPAAYRYSKEQTEFSLAVLRVFELYEGMQETSLATKDINRDLQLLQRSAQGLADRWEREFAKVNGEAFLGDSQDSVQNLSWQ